jgi:hypothetical protein
MMKSFNPKLRTRIEICKYKNDVRRWKTGADSKRNEILLTRNTRVTKIKGIGELSQNENTYD